MGKTKEQLLEELKNAVIEMEDESVVEDLAKEYLDGGFPAYDGIMHGLVEGMNEVSILYDEEEYFITDVLLASDAMYAGLNVLRPHLDATNNQEEKKIKAVIGVVEGDTHDIGKNLVKIMMESAGFEMVDLGRDVDLDKFITTVKEEEISLVCMSTLMTTTMGGMKTVIERLKEEGLRDKVKVMVGGGPISQKYAEEIGADAYTPNAVRAVEKAKELLQ